MTTTTGKTIAVGVSGSGSNLRALVAAADRGELGGVVTLVFADRACPALGWAAEQGIETILVPGGDDEVLAETLAAVEPDVVVLAGYLRLVGPRVLDAFEGRILNVHPSVLPAFPGLHAVRDALRAGVAVTGVTVHLVDATLDGGPIVAQEAVPVAQDDTEDTLLARLHAVEHRLLPTAVRAVPPVETSSNPRATRPRPSSTRPVLSDTESSARRGVGIVASARARSITTWRSSVVSDRAPATASATTRGRRRCSTAWIRPRSVASSSPGRIGTASWATIGPPSSVASTRWTVTPVTATPAASASRIACAPGNAGSSDGWTLRIRSGNRASTVEPITRM